MKFNKLTITLASFALCLEAQASLSFTFDYTGSVEFNDPTGGIGAARQAALESAANTLGSFFNDTATLEYSVTSSNANTTTLASAGAAGRSAFLSTRGYHSRIPRHEILTGIDANGATADGSINVNFFHSWDLDDNVAAGSFDFKGVFMHELLHTLGFASGIRESGQDNWGFTDGEDGTSPTGIVVGGIWTPYDDFVVDTNGDSIINDGNFTIDQTLWDAESTGGNSQNNDGLFWGGANAVAANGGELVGLYTPGTWNGGSSVSHLDTNNPAYAGSMMNHAVTTGPAARTLTAIEQGMLMDLGYSIVVPEPSSALLLGLGSLALIVRRRK